MFLQAESIDNQVIGNVCDSPAGLDEIRYDLLVLLWCWRDTEHQSFVPVWPPVGHKVRNFPRFFIQLDSSTTSLSRRSSRFWSTLLLRLKEVSAPAGLRAWRLINYVPFKLIILQLSIYGEEICILLSNIFTTPLYHQQSSQPTPTLFSHASFYSYCFDWSDW